MRKNRLDIRYAWIEASIRYSGRFDKVSYGDYFDLNPSQISTDQFNFMQAFNHEVRHMEECEADTLVIERGKLSVAEPLPDTAIFAVPDLREWLRTLSIVPFYEVNKFTSADPNIDVLKEILSSVSHRQPVQITLLCKLGEEDVRHISPHALFDVQGSIFTRYWDHEKMEFCDLALERIASVDPTGLPFLYKDAKFDKDWIEKRSANFLKNSFLSSQVDLKGSNGALINAYFPSALSPYVSNQLFINFGDNIRIEIFDEDDQLTDIKIERAPNDDDDFSI